MYNNWFVSDNSFFKWLVHDLVIYFDGLSFLALLLLHNKNFKNSKPAPEN